LAFVFIVLRELNFVKTNRSRVEILDLFANLRRRQDEDSIRQQQDMISDMDESTTSDMDESTTSQLVEPSTTQQSVTTPALDSEVNSVTSSQFSIDTNSTKQDQNIMQMMTQKLYKLVDSTFDDIGTFDESNLSRLCLDIFDLVRQAIPSATTELLSSIHKLLKLYTSTSVMQYRDDLIKDTLDIIQDELVFNRVVETIDHSYQEDIFDLNSKLSQLQKKRAEDIENLRQNRIVSLKSDSYPLLFHQQQDTSMESIAQWIKKKVQDIEDEQEYITLQDLEARSKIQEESEESYGELLKKDAQELFDQIQQFASGDDQQVNHVGQQTDDEQEEMFMNESPNDDQRKFRFDAETIEEKIRQEEREYNDLFIKELPSIPVELSITMDPADHLETIHASTQQDALSEFHRSCAEQLHLLMLKYKS
jgi:hypothetical protein